MIDPQLVAILQAMRANTYEAQRHLNNPDSQSARRATWEDHRRIRREIAAIEGAISAVYAEALPEDIWARWIYALAHANLQRERRLLTDAEFYRLAADLRAARDAVPA